MADLFKSVRRKFKAARSKRQKLALAPKEPKLLAARYSVLVLGFIEQIHNIIREELLPELRLDAFPIPIQRKLDIIEIRISELVDAPIVDNAATRVAKEIASSNTKQWKRLLRIPIDPDVEPLINSFVSRNTLLIKSQASETIRGIKGIIEGRIGARHEDLAGEIEHFLGVKKSRARFIARDQTLKLHGQISQAAQTSVGIEEYEWSTSQDDDVRERHEELDGTIHRWDTPPEVSDDGRHEHPGGDFQCRCVAVPVLPDF